MDWNPQSALNDFVVVTSLAGSGTCSRRSITHAMAKVEERLLM
jgi:hypothetical protein